MVRRSVRALTVAAACTGVAVLALSCENPNSVVTTRRSALVGDPIESVQRVEGVVPVTINNELFPPDGGSIDQTSFTIGLFEEDASQCAPVNGSFCLLSNGSPQPVSCACSIMTDLDPLHRGYPNGTPYPAFEDFTVVAATINVGAAKAMHWDWQYNAYYQRPFGEFWAEVVDQSGQTTTVIPSVAAPERTGFRPLRVPATPPFMTGPQHVDLDLTPWAEQTISVRFILHTHYDPTFFRADFPDGSSAFMGAFDAGASKVYVDNLHVDACSVTSVEFEQVDSPLEPNRGVGGGLRMFPDKQTPNDLTDRSLVRVVAHMNKPNCPVTFRSLDVDDPSADGAIDPNGSDGNDNNAGLGACGSFKDDNTCSISCGEADGNGCTISQHAPTTAVTLRVSRQPGDNFVVVASSDPSALNGITIGATTSAGPTIKDGAGKDLSKQMTIKATPMVTVWRRLHVERDSMGLVAGNHEAGRIVANNAAGADNIRLALDVTLTPTDRFKGGRIAAGSFSFPVISSDDRSVTIANPGAAVLNQIGRSTFLLYDDDDFNGNDTAMLRGDEGEHVPAPDISLMSDTDDPLSNLFFDAYVRPTYDLGSDGGALFVFNLPDDEADQIRRAMFGSFDHVSTEADPDFWTVYLLGAYQGLIDESNDPAGRLATVGQVDELGGQGANIFFATLQDVGTSATNNAAITAVHEVGHLFNLEHGQGGIMGDDDRGLVITQTTFSAQSISAIRSSVHP